MPALVSNPRDLLVQQLGELLYIERRLADAVLPELAQAAHDEELQAALERHREETVQHVERVETVFRRLGFAPTSNRSAPFEALVEQHGRLTSSIVEPHLADVHHATAALRTEHDELAMYTAVLALADGAGHGDDVDELTASMRDEDAARAGLEQALGRLAEAARAG